MPFADKAMNDLARYFPATSPLTLNRPVTSSSTTLWNCCPTTSQVSSDTSSSADELFSLIDLRMRKTRHSRSELRNEDEEAERSSDESARPSSAAQNDVKNGIHDVPEEPRNYDISAMLRKPFIVREGTYCRRYSRENNHYCGVSLYWRP